jgi:hypothetical protein
MTSPGTSVAITPEIEALLAAEAAGAAPPEAAGDSAMDATLAAGNAPSPPRPKFDVGA